MKLHNSIIQNHTQMYFLPIRHILSIKQGQKRPKMQSKRGKMLNF